MQMKNLTLTKIAYILEKHFKGENNHGYEGKF